MTDDQTIILEHIKGIVGSTIQQFDAETNDQHTRQNIIKTISEELTELIEDQKIFDYCVIYREIVDTKLVIDTAIKLEKDGNEFFYVPYTLHFRDINKENK